VIVAVASPAVRDHDSFPLSTYPIYATARGDVVPISTAVGIDTAGRTHTLDMATIADTDDPLIAESLVDRAIQTGQADQLCSEIAKRAPREVDAIEVVEEHHGVVARASGKDSLVQRVVHARCRVRS
jgi:hypothetical protein